MGIAGTPAGDTTEKITEGAGRDYPAESFLAGNLMGGGGVAIANGLCCDTGGALHELPTLYPDSNLFSPASGNAMYIRDPHDCVSETQPNGGEFVELSNADRSAH